MLDTLNFTLLSVGVAVAAGVIFGFVVFFNNRQSATTRSFLFLALVTGLWGVVNYAACNASTESMALFLTRLVMALAVWQAYALFRFFYVFPDPNCKLPAIADAGLIIWAAIVSALSFTSLIFSGLINYIPTLPPTTVTGVGMPIFGITAIGFVFSGLVYFWRRTFLTDRHERLPFIIIWIGAVATFLLIIVFSYLFPALLNRSDFVPLGAIFTFPFILFTGYAIIKHRLLNIRIIGTEFFAFALAITILSEVVLANTVSLAMFRFGIFILVVFFGVSLTRSVIREVEQKERLQKLSDELKIANVRLQELDQQKTDFLSIASHQLRTPLTVFKGFLELLEDGGYGKPTKDMMKVFKDLDTNNEHLVKLVDEFLNVSRIEQGRTKWDFKENNINQIVTEAVQQLNDKANNKKMEIVWSNNSQPLSAIMDQEKIFHVVYNYIDNAIKYSDHGQVIIKVSEENDGIALRVKDSGIGFGAVDGASFFQKFYRGQNTKMTDNVTGTGLGIFICKKFVEGHGGRVWAVSDGPGKGSEFGFWLPWDGQIAGGVKK